MKSEAMDWKNIEFSEVDLMMVLLDDQEVHQKEILVLEERVRLLKNQLVKISNDLEAMCERSCIDPKTLSSLKEKRDCALKSGLIDELSEAYYKFNGANSIDEWVDRGEGRIPWEGERLEKNFKERMEEYRSLIRKQFGMDNPDSKK